jgi:hypothetical protein
MTECVCCITILGRKEWIDSFKSTFGGDNRFDLQQTFYIPKIASIEHRINKWGTSTMYASEILIKKPEEIVILAKTADNPPLLWARRVAEKFAKRGEVITIQVAHYNIKLKSYGIFIAKNHSISQKRWQILDGSVEDPCSHFGNFVKQFTYNKLL